MVPLCAATAAAAMTSTLIFERPCELWADAACVAESATDGAAEITVLQDEQVLQDEHTAA